MTNHKQLADRIVALGVGYAGPMPAEYDQPETVYAIGTTYLGTAENFVNDPRVAMAMMEKCRGRVSIFHNRNGDWTVDVGNIDEWHKYASNESLPLAINMACAEALSE